MRRFNCILAAILISVTAFGQAEMESKGIKILEKNPSAPNTASLGKYFDVPVNMATGIPNISVPVFTLKTGNISLPITLNYHGGGIKVNDPASWVGLGWDLSFGGVITKQVNGLDDFHSTNQYYNHPPGSGTGAYSNYFNPSYQIEGDSYLGFTNMSAVIDSLTSPSYVPGGDSVYRLLGRVIKNVYDGESDEYHYSTPIGGGTIYYNQKTAKFEINKINGWDAAYDSNNDVWGLRSSQGLHYVFDMEERTNIPERFSASGQSYYSSAWYLTNISDISNNKGVNLTYESSTDNGTATGVSTYADYQAYGSHSYTGGSTETIYRSGTQVVVTKINFPEGRIEFIKDTASRLDGGIKALKAIKVYDLDSVLKKQINFQYYYAWNVVSNAKRLMLHSVQEVNYTNGLTNQSKPYLFYYDTTISMPARFSYAQDIWGYNNGKTSNSTLLPTTVESIATGLPYFANRWVDTNYTKSGIITRMVYPTGGSLNFVFENNRDYNDSLVGGLRIKRITNYDSVANKKLVTEYRYNDDNGHSTGTIPARPIFQYTFGKGAVLDANWRVSADALYPLMGNQGSYISYGRVEKVEVGDSVELKSRHYFNNDVVSSHGGNLANYQNMFGTPRNKLSNMRDFSNILMRTEIFKKQGGAYSLTQKDSLGYSTLQNFEHSIWNVHAAWAVTLGWVEWTGNDPYSFPTMNAIPSINAYKLFHESLVNDVSASTSYDDNGTQLQQITYKQYDTANGNLKKITMVASNGDTLRTYFSYAADYSQYPSTSNSINIQINNLLDYNFLAAPIEMISTRKQAGGSEYVTDANVYLYENNKLKKHLKINEDVLLSSVTLSYNNNTAFYYDSKYKLESEIDSFDVNRNPTQMTLKNKVQSLIWDNENILATAVNANLADIAATSFESTTKGKWSYSGTVVTDNTAPTGKKAYTLNTGNITRSSLSTSKTYIVSYWSKNGSFNVNSTSAITGRTSNGWTYYEHKVVNPSSGLITVSGTGSIDELRLHPQGALMNTYTYQKLLGMSSQCDPANRIAYYEYDQLGRLYLLRDQDRNIVKKICYNYAGQQEICDPLYYNVQKSGNYTRNNCGANYTGSTVTYIVPAGTYSSPLGQAYVDSVAQAAVNANGQAYANSNGTCTPNCNSGNCNAEGYKCVNGVCEYGVQVATECIYDDLQGTWTITYHYEWSDSTWSGNYVRYNADTSWCGE
jgi:hypothetical protein